MSGANPIDATSGDEEFEEIIGLLREGPIEPENEAMSSAVWAGISSELGLNETDESYALDGNCFGVVGANDDVVVDMAGRRSAWGKPAALLTLAAAVVLLIAVPLFLALRSDDSAELLAAAELEVLDGQEATAVVADLWSDGGDLAMTVDAPTSVGDGEFLEVWLLEVGDDGVKALQSLGAVDDSGRYDVPDDIDLDRFTVVDISVELDDGNDDHSGNSVVRGEFG